MKYIVELTISNPSHEHISLRKVQKKTNFVVEANNEPEAILRATRKFRSLGNYVHEATIVAEKAMTDDERYGKTGAAIRSRHGEAAYKARPKYSRDPRDNLSYLAKLDAEKKARDDAGADERTAVGTAATTTDAAPTTPAVSAAAAGSSAGPVKPQDAPKTEPEKKDDKPEAFLTVGGSQWLGRDKEGLFFGKKRGDETDEKGETIPSVGVALNRIGRAVNPARWFRKRDSEATTTEEFNYIEEKLTLKDPMSKWISDFVHSENPRFEGKSKKERINMALGARYAAERAAKNEEVEQVDEARLPHVATFVPLKRHIENKSLRDAIHIPVNVAHGDKSHKEKLVKKIGAEKAAMYKLHGVFPRKIDEEVEQVKEEAEGKLAVTPKEKTLAAHHGDPKRITFGDVLKARLKGKKVDEESEIAKKVREKQERARAESNAKQDKEAKDHLKSIGMSDENIAKKMEKPMREQAAPVPNPNAVPKPPKQPKEPGTTDYSKELELDPSFPSKHPLELERPAVEAEVKKRQAELAKQAAEKAKVKKEEVEQVDEANMRFDPEAAARPKSSDVKNFLNRNKNPRAAAASNKYIRRMTKLGGLGPNQTKKDTEAHMKAHFEEVEQIDEAPVVQIVKRIVKAVAKKGDDVVRQVPTAVGTEKTVAAKTAAQKADTTLQATGGARVPDVKKMSADEYKDYYQRRRRGASQPEVPSNEPTPPTSPSPASPGARVVDLEKRRPAHAISQKAMQNPYAKVAIGESKKANATPGLQTAGGNELTTTSMGDPRDAKNAGPTTMNTQTKGFEDEMSNKIAAAVREKVKAKLNKINTKPEMETDIKQTGR